MKETIRLDVDTDISQPEKILCNLEDIVMLADNHVGILCDIIVTSNELFIIPHETFRLTNTDTDTDHNNSFPLYTVAGLLIGNIGGAMVGALLDDFRTSSSENMNAKSNGESGGITRERAIRGAHYYRMKDKRAGLSFKQRASMRKGTSFVRDEVRHASRNRNSVALITTNNDKFQFPAENEDKARLLSKTINSWMSETIPPQIVPVASLEEIDYNPELEQLIIDQDVISEFFTTNGGTVPEDLADRICNSSGLLSNFIDKMTESKSDHRDSSIAWLKKNRTELYSALISRLQNIINDNKVEKFVYGLLTLLLAYGCSSSTKIFWIMILAAGTLICGILTIQSVVTEIKMRKLLQNFELLD